MAWTGDQVNIQTSVSNNYVAAIEGLLVEQFNGAMVRSRTLTTASSAGAYMKKGTTEELIDIPAASADVTTFTSIGGIICYDPAKSEWPPVSGVIPTTPFPAGQVATVLIRGEIWVFVEEAVSPTSTVYVRYATGTGAHFIGAFRASDPGSQAAALPTNTAQYVGTTTGAGLVKLSVNFA